MKNFETPVKLSYLPKYSTEPVQLSRISGKYFRNFSLFDFLKAYCIFALFKSHIHNVIIDCSSLYMRDKEEPANLQVYVNVNCPFLNALVMHENYIFYELVKLCGQRFKIEIIISAAVVVRKNPFCIKRFVIEEWIFGCSSKFSGS